MRTLACTMSTRSGGQAQIMIEITTKPIRPEITVKNVKDHGNGCVVTYIGFIRDFSQGKPVLCVEYTDATGNAENELRDFVIDAELKYSVNAIALSHRTGKMNVGDINLVIAVASSHREDGFKACKYVVDRFKQKLPTEKIETYLDDTLQS